jgi:UDP-N-acetylmuramyl tripeptide synthase
MGNRQSTFVANAFSTLRLAAAVTAGKAVATVVRRLNRGGGTALPGLVAERIEPRVVARLAGQLGGGCVLVTGTNGKTTTSRVLASILREARQPLLHNREGSNLMRGIASALLSAAGPSGRIAGSERMLGLFETDEATLPAAARTLAPRAIAFTNLFRDQLDRYGEVDSVFEFWRRALAGTPASATLVLNADDPSVAELAEGWSGPVEWFGLDAPEFATTSGGAFDARWCRECGGTFEYDLRYFAHVGYWRCPGCGRARVERPAVVARQITLSVESSMFVVDGLGAVTMPLTGLYNVSNALAAIAMARVLGIEDGPIVRGLAGVEAAFGRQETVVVEGRKLRLMLVKNPAGANQVLQLLGALARSADSKPLHVAVLLNDRFADGQDVSWTWDVDFEPLAPSLRRVWVGGTRAPDMALRLKYAHWPAAAAVEESPATLLDAILRDTSAGDDVFVVPTYTALLDFRGELARRGAVGEFWAHE